MPMILHLINVYKCTMIYSIYISISPMAFQSSRLRTSPGRLPRRGQRQVVALSVACPSRWWPRSWAADLAPLAPWLRRSMDGEIIWGGGHRFHIWLVVGPPLWKIWKSIGMMTFPIYGKMKNVPNHQPDMISQVPKNMDGSKKNDSNGWLG